MTLNSVILQAFNLVCFLLQLIFFEQFLCVGEFISDVDGPGLNRVFRSGPGISQNPVHFFLARPDRPGFGPGYPGFVDRVGRS